MTVPFSRLPRKDMFLNWSNACQEEFALLKRAFTTTAPILHHFDPALPPIVERDASDYAIAGMFSPRTGDGCIHPVAFYSRTPSGAELSYDTHDKELLAIYEAFKTWRHYLESLRHTIDAVRAAVWIALQARGVNCDPVGAYSVVFKPYCDTDYLCYCEVCPNSECLGI